MKSVRNMLFTALLLLLAGQAQAFLGFSKYDQLKANGDSVSIPVADVSDGKAHYFQFGDGDKAIKFFVVKSADGKIRSAFDACDVCFKEKKGYANYYFNELERDRLTAAFKTAGDFTPLQGAWMVPPMIRPLKP